MRGCSQGGVRCFIRGHAWFYQGGVHGFIWEACMVLSGGACMVLSGGACMVLSGGACVVLFGGCMVLFGGCVWFYSGGAWFYSGGMRGFFWGACVVFPVFSDTMRGDPMRYGQ